VCSIMDNFLNQSYSKCNQDTVYMKNVKSRSLIFFYLTSRDSSRDDSRVRAVHALSSPNEMKLVGSWDLRWKLQTPM
jgi:hypothetical protein